MREILFRGKKVANGEWVEGYYNYISEGEGTYDREQHFIQTEYKGRFGMCWEVNPETVCQFTGMYDKNGRKIFEGDIVKGHNFIHVDRTIYQVVYEENGFYYRDEDGVTWHPANIDNVEIVGNIYDNPELLEEKK